MHDKHMKEAVLRNFVRSASFLSPSLLFLERCFYVTYRLLLSGFYVHYMMHADFIYRSRFDKQKLKQHHHVLSYNYSLLDTELEIFSGNGGAWRPWC